MEVESPSCMEENDVMTFITSKVENEDESTTREEKFFHSDVITNPKKRRLVITTKLEEPILIEIRPNFLEPKAYSLVSSTTQCNIFEEECCTLNVCSKHIDLWNEFIQAIHETNIDSGCALEGNSPVKIEDVNDSIFGIEKPKTCNKFCYETCVLALNKMTSLKDEVQKEKLDSETNSIALAKVSELESQVEVEKNLQIKEREKYEALILELRSQITSQAEEIRRLWIENLAIEKDDVNANLNEIKLEEDTPETSLQCTNGIQDSKIVVRDQEIQCEDKSRSIDVLTHDKSIECDNLVSNLEEMEMEKEKITSKFGDDRDIAKIMEEHEDLIKERDNLREELEKVNNNFNRTTSKLRDNVAKRRRLEAASEDEKQQRSNLAAALYELENEIDETTSTMNTLQSSAIENMVALTSDLQEFQEVLEKQNNYDNHETNCIVQDNDMINENPDDCNETKEGSLQNCEKKDSDTFKGISESKKIISNLTQGHDNLLKGINTARETIKKTLQIYKFQVFTTNNEIKLKIESIESEIDSFRWKTKALEEENKVLEEEKSILLKELSSLKHANFKLNLQVKDYEKEVEDSQESLKTLREENRRLLKEAKWKSVGKQGGYQESLIIQEWEKKLQRLEADYEILRHTKKDLVKEKHRLENELEMVMGKGSRGFERSGDQKLEEELLNMTQERNKLRKIKITLAIENVSLKESLAELRIQADALETECETLPQWKEKVKKLEEECEDLRDWKNKAEALEIECKDLHDNQMKAEAHEMECKVKSFETLQLDSKEENGEKECQHVCHSEDGYEEECKRLRERITQLENECQSLHQKIDKKEDDVEELKGRKCKDLESSSRCEPKPNILTFETDENKVSNEKILHPPNSSIESCSVEDYIEKIANLEKENMRLSQSHQSALDKQWDVLQGDLKAYEAKIEELENECESVRRDHLSSMVENEELVREKEKLLSMYNDQKYNYEILETANECLQKKQEETESKQAKERNEYHTSIDNLNQQIIELESKFSEKLQQQASNYKMSLATNTNINGQETITLSRQEYEILLAEKAVMLQERDSAHKKLCSAEVQNRQLSARIECLQQEVPCSNNGSKQKGSDNEILLAQDVINLRSMLNTQEEEIQTVTCERNKLLEMSISMREELSELHEALIECQHQNQALSIALEEVNRRSSLEQIHSAASSLKEQLGKASKEKDAIKDQLNKSIKENERLINATNEKDKVIIALKEKVSKLEKREESLMNIPSQVAQKNNSNQMEKDKMKEDVLHYKQELKVLSEKMLFVSNDLTTRTKLWENEQSALEEKCRKSHLELTNTKETLLMIRKKMQDDLQEITREKIKLGLSAQKEIKSAHAQVCQLQNEFSQIKLDFKQELNLAREELENITLQKDEFLLEITKLNKQMNKMENLLFSTCNITKNKEHPIEAKMEIEDQNQVCPHLIKTLVERGTQVIFDKKENIISDKEENISSDKEENISSYKEENISSDKEENISSDTDTEPLSQCEEDSIPKSEVVIKNNDLPKMKVALKKQHKFHRLDDVNIKIEFDEISSPKYEDLSFLNDHQNLIAKVASLQKEKEVIWNKLNIALKQDSTLLTYVKNALSKVEQEISKQHVNQVDSNMQLEEKIAIQAKITDRITYKSKDILGQIFIARKLKEDVKEELGKETAQFISYIGNILKTITEKKKVLFENEEDLIAMGYDLDLTRKQKQNWLVDIQKVESNYLNQNKFTLSDQRNKGNEESDTTPTFNNTKMLNIQDRHTSICDANKHEMLGNVKTSNKTNTFDQLGLEKKHIIQENTFLNELCNVIFDKLPSLPVESDVHNSFDNFDSKECALAKERSTVYQFKEFQIYMNILKEQRESFKKENETLYALRNENPTNKSHSFVESISILKNQHHNIFLHEYEEKGKTTSKSYSQKKANDVLEIVSEINENQEGQVVESKQMRYAIESLTKECDNIFATIAILEDEQQFLLSSVDIQRQEKIDDIMIIDNNDPIKMINVLKTKLSEFSKKIVVLLKAFITCTKEREHLKYEITSLKEECQKLHTSLVVAERDKDTLMKSVIESRSTFDRLFGEGNQLQRELIEVDMKLKHITTERDNANLQIIELQRLLSNQLTTQHLQGPFSTKKVDSIEAQVRCSRMEKEKYQFHQQFPSMTNFNIQNIDQHPPSHSVLHSPQQFFLSGLNPLGRPRPPLPINHQQWPLQHYHSKPLNP